MKQILDTLTAGQSRIQEHFHFLHQNPGLAFEETVAANYIAGKLREWGYEVTEGIGQTGVVARLKVGDGQASIGLRADTDALPVQEGADLPYKSRIEGQSHMCGHDAHASMLLGAAEYLAKTRNFNGTLNLIFQPAEEIMAGAPGMIADGLFEKFPMDAMFGMHNMPGLPVGKMHFTSGPIMAAVDNWEIVLTGVGSHGSMPEKSIDPLVAGAALVMSLQTIVSREVGGAETAVVTVGTIHAGSAANIIPADAELVLNVRTFTDDVRTRVIEAVGRIARAEAAASGAPREPDIEPLNSFPAVVNDPDAVERTRAALQAAAGFVVDPGSITGSEDVGMLASAAGAPCVYWLLGGADHAAFEGATTMEQLAERVRTIPSNHSPLFAPVIEPTLTVGIAALVAAAREWLRADGP